MRDEKIKTDDRSTEEYKDYIEQNQNISCFLVTDESRVFIWPSTVHAKISQGEESILPAPPTAVAAAAAGQECT